MQRLLLSIAILVSVSSQALTHDAPSAFVDQALTSAQNILAEKDEAARQTGMCTLLKEKMGSEAIATVWLGTYKELQREAAAVAQFPSLVPSIMITKAIPLLGGGGEGTSITVNPVAKERSPGIFEVSVTITVNNKDYLGTAVVQEIAVGLFKINDVEYMGLSAVGYQGRDFQQFMKREFEKDPANSLPITALIQHITSQSDYINCP